MVAGYLGGWFPMDEPGARGPVGWYECDPRAVLPVDGFRVPRTVARTVRRRGYAIRIDTAFDAVLTACAARRTGVWLTPRLAAGYSALHLVGLAHSVEAWDGERLVGGLFGVALGGLYTSESMFHRAPDGGNAVLLATAGHLAERGFTLWDVQMASDHTRRFGLEEIRPAEYRRRLRRALAARPAFA
ncbi:MAG: leucyl/phenylalanyl-tRNA--protein transferase [Thermoleophilia bacterium]|jgi:leucyl/phenylalanyl-tRNA--protein transferase|nr:leucyl/phenylalanyl-tRNA--protein transferase [Thermoleophilia bacterium]